MLERNHQEFIQTPEYVEVEVMNSAYTVFLKKCAEVYDGKLIVCRKNHENQHFPEVVRIPEGVTVLDEEAFFQDHDIIQVICPESLQVMGSLAFALCSRLEEVVLPKRMCGKLCEAFSESSALRVIEIPNGITEIGEDTFSYCSGLEAVTIPGTVKRIGSRAFYECLSLKELYIPDSVAEINTVASIASCKSLERVHLPENVRFIHDEDCGYTLFMDCPSLRELFVGDKRFLFYPEEVEPMEVDRELTDEEIKGMLAIYCRGRKPYAVADEVIERVRRIIEEF